MFDCHMHTKFSTDSIMDACEACETAISQGLSGIAFTDHHDIGFPGNDDSWSIDFNQYFQDISLVKGKYKDRLKVLKAVEIGIQPHVIDESEALIKSFPFDYVLASVHIIDGLDPYIREYYRGKSKFEAYDRYLKEIYYMISNFSDYDMVGHFEYIIRYANYVDRTLRYADHTDIFDSILKELINRGRGFEVNTGSFRDPKASAEYDFAVLKRYKELGGEFICLGSDAHRPEHIALRFEYFTQMLKDAGFNYTVHFENRKPVWDKI